MTSLPARSRASFPGISSRAWEHPADRGALTTLRAVPGFDTVLRALSGLLRERSLRLLYLSSAVRVSERQYGELHRRLVEGARLLDLPDVPELYVERNPDANAFTIGMDRPFIVVTTGLLDLVEDEELQFVLGHELGHAASGHAVYRTMLMQLIALSQRTLWFPVGNVVLRGVVYALEEWYRKSELSGDRAGLLVVQDPTVALSVQMKIAGGARPEDTDPTEFLAQAREYEAAGDVRDGVLKLLNTLGSGTHPFAVVRAGELRRWVDSGAYAAVLAGDYPCRADDPTASPTDEVRAAVKSYRQSFGESTDPLVTFLRSTGEDATAAGQATAQAAASAARGATDFVRGLFTPRPPAGPDGSPGADDEDGSEAAGPQ